MGCSLGFLRHCPGGYGGGHAREILTGRHWSSSPGSAAGNGGLRSALPTASLLQ
ncbi:hypothetical protein PT7_0290 [Pusillimonas sp. T7-7]|nr:hypothetical protein PT7_0290 [Pusillimonas sp. T7-7]